MASYGALLGSSKADHSGAVSGNAFTQSITTGVGSGTNCRITVEISYWASRGATDGPTGLNDGAAYTRDLQFPNANGQDVIEFWSRPVTSTQLASASSITVSF